MRLALMSECDRAWLSEIDVLLLNYPVHIRKELENEGEYQLITLRDDEDLQAWADSEHLQLQIVESKNFII